MYYESLPLMARKSPRTPTTCRSEGNYHSHQTTVSNTVSCVSGSFSSSPVARKGPGDLLVPSRTQEMPRKRDACRVAVLPHHHALLMCIHSESCLKALKYYLCALVTLWKHLIPRLYHRGLRKSLGNATCRVAVQPHHYATTMRTYQITLKSPSDLTTLSSIHLQDKYY
jgi:hypothetical protein